MNMDAALSTLDTKLIQLQFARERAEEIIQSKRRDKIERQIKALKELSGEADQLKRTLEGMKIAAKESAEEVKQWNDQIEEKITKADDDVLRLKEWLKKAKREENQKIREEELVYERLLFETRLKFQTELNAVKSNKAEGSESAKNSDHCQKFGTRWRLRVRTKAIMAVKSYKEMYGNKETFSNISIMSLRVFGARLQTC